MIGPAPPPANPNAVKDMAQKDLELKKRQQDRVDAAAKVEKAKEVDTRRRDLCLAVRGRLKEMREGKAVFRYDASGPLRLLLDLLLERGRVDLDVGARLEPGEIGHQELPADFLAHLLARHLDLRIVELLGLDHLRHPHDRVAAAPVLGADVAGQ